MKLALLGATGGVGREVLCQAIAAGYAVTAVVRNPSKLPADVDVVRQDLATPDADVLVAALRDVDAVIFTVGPHRAAQAGIVAPATAAITHAMGCAGVRRLVVISAAPVGVVPSTHRPQPPRHDPGDDLLMRYLLSPLIRRLFGRLYIDLAAMEDLLRDRSLDWTSIRPPRLTNGPLTGTYRTAIDRNVRHGLLSDEEVFPSSAGARVEVTDRRHFSIAATNVSCASSSAVSKSPTNRSSRPAPGETRRATRSQRWRRGSLRSWQ